METRSCCFRGGHGAGQSTVEYAVLIAVLAGALIAMQIYIKRGLAGRMRDAADSVGEQFAPRQTTSDFTTTMQGTTTTDSRLAKRPALNAQGQPEMDAQGNPVLRDAIVTTTTIDPDAPETTARRGSETVGALGGDLWND